METTEQLKRAIEDAAAALGISPSTVGERAGQGGRFYARLCDGRRVWPETAQSVRAKIAEMIDHAEKHGHPSATVQGEGAE